MSPLVALDSEYQACTTTLLIFETEFRFSVANFDTGWSWALAGAGPTVGDEHWSGARSTGGTPCPDGGPHCGPWSELQGRDFAFRLTATPEPSTLAMSVAGLALVVFGRRRGLFQSRS